MLDKIILGLLSKKDLTAYDIKVLMNKSISNFYSNSFGSINPSLKKLEKQQFITCSEKTENSRLKKFYAITHLGRKVYKNWLGEPIALGRIKDDVLARVFFLGDADKSTQQQVVSAYLEDLNSAKEDLKKIQEHSLENLSAQDQQKFKFQFATLQFGIDYMNFKKQWFENLINEL